MVETIIAKMGFVVGAAFISGCLYRLGGWEKGNRLFRIIGCPAISLVLYLWLFGLSWSLWWAYLAYFGACAGAISAYWGLDEAKWGYWAHGLGLSLAAFPIAYVTGNWIGFVLRTVILTAFITIWSEYTKWDILEEWGRGFILTATIPLLLF
jgi:hypothetical protein